MNRSRAGARSAEAPGRGRRARSAPGVLIRRRALLGAAAGATAGLLGGCGERANKVPFWFAYGGKNREALLALVSRFNTEQPQHALSPVFQGDYFELLAKLRTAIHAERAPALTHVVGEVPPTVERVPSADALPGLDRDFGLQPALTQAGAFEGGDTRPLDAIHSQHAHRVHQWQRPRRARPRAPDHVGRARDVRARGDARLRGRPPLWLLVPDRLVVLGRDGRAGGR